MGVTAYFLSLAIMIYLKEFPLYIYIYIYIISILTTSGERDLNSNLYIFKAKAGRKYN